MTPIQESAAILMRLPPGKRRVHIAGFAGDITAYGDARAAAASGSMQLSADSGLERGIERVRDRVLHRMRALRAAGARIDGFTVEHPTALPQGPFGDMVIADAVDSAVLEVFPRAEAPRRGEPEGAHPDEACAGLEADAGMEADAADDDGSGVVATDPEPASGGSADARTATTADKTGSGPSQPCAGVPHWETTMQEQGIQWERIMSDTQSGLLASARR